MKSCISPPSFHFKKGLAKFTIGVRLIHGFRQKGAFSALSRGASYTRMRLIPEYIRYLQITVIKTFYCSMFTLDTTLLLFYSPIDHVIYQFFNNNILHVV